MLKDKFMAFLAEHNIQAEFLENLEDHKGTIAAEFFFDDYPADAWVGAAFVWTIAKHGDHNSWRTLNRQWVEALKAK